MPPCSPLTCPSPSPVAPPICPSQSPHLYPIHLSPNLSHSLPVRLFITPTSVTLGLPRPIPSVCPLPSLSPSPGPPSPTPQFLTKYLHSLPNHLFPSSVTPSWVSTSPVSPTCPPHLFLCSSVILICMFIRHHFYLLIYLPSPVCSPGPSPVCPLTWSSSRVSSPGPSSLVHPYLSLLLPVRSPAPSPPVPLTTSSPLTCL